MSWAQEVNFSNLRTRRRDAERLPDVRRVDCIVVSLLPFKSALDDQMQRLHDALCLGLRRSVVDDAKQIDEFAFLFLCFFHLFFSFKSVCLFRCSDPIVMIVLITHGSAVCWLL